MDLYIRVAYLIDWIHNRKCQETWGNEVFDILPSDFEKVVKMAKIRCFSKKVKISKWVGKNIEKAYKIVLFCKKIYLKITIFRWLNNNMRCFEIFALCLDEKMIKVKQ